MGRTGSVFNETNSVYIDAHVLASATLADVNGDGNQYLIIPISYYFDKAKYIHKLDYLDYDPEMYVAGGVACWNLNSQDWVWTVHLDMST